MASNDQKRIATKKSRIETEGSSDIEDDDDDVKETEEALQLMADVAEPSHERDVAMPDRQIQANFGFYDPSEKDFHSMSEVLRQQYRDFTDLNVAELVDTIIQQSTVGSVVRCEDDEEEEAFVLGVVSVMNFHRYRELSSLQMIRSVLLQNCREAEKRAAFEQVMKSADTGLIINERLVNVPPEIGPPFNQALFEEISWGQEDEPTQELRESFKFKQYIIITRVYEDLSPPPAQPRHSAKKSKVVTGPGRDFLYLKPEDEFYHQFCSDWYTYTLTERLANDGNMEVFRLVMCISHDAAQQARVALDGVVGNPAAG